MAAGGSGNPRSFQSEPEKTQGEVGVLVIGVEGLVEDRSVLQSNGIEILAPENGRGGRDTKSVFEFANTVIRRHSPIDLDGKTQTIECQTSAIDNWRIVGCDDRSLDRGQSVIVLECRKQGPQPWGRGLCIVVEQGNE